jgi:sulfate transport system permease protein
MPDAIDTPVEEIAVPRAVPALRIASPTMDGSTPSADRRPRKAEVGRWALTGGVLLYLALVLVLPLAVLAWKAMQGGAGAIFRALTTHEALFALGQSLLLVALAMAVNGVVGLAGGFVLARHRFRGRLFFDALVDLPLALSPVMVGLSFLLLFGRQGLLAPVMEALDVKVAFAFPGLLLCTLLVTLPFTIREVGGVLEALGTSDEEAAATLGASPWQIFWRVTLPNVRHALTLGLTLAAARALGEFGAVLVVGGAISGRTQTATTFIYAAVEERDTVAAYGMAVLLAAVSLLLLALLQTFKKHQER